MRLADDDESAGVRVDDACDDAMQPVRRLPWVAARPSRFQNLVPRCPHSLCYSGKMSLWQADGRARARPRVGGLSKMYGWIM